MAGVLSRIVLWRPEEEVVGELAYMAHVLDPSQGAIVNGRGSTGRGQDLIHSLWLDLDIKVCIGGKIETVGGHGQNEDREEQEKGKGAEEGTAEVQRDNCESARGVEGVA